MLEAGHKYWRSWLEALPRSALVGLLKLASVAHEAPSGGLRRLALVYSQDEQVRAELDCGRDILTGLVDPLVAGTVEELVQAVRPAAARLFKGQSHPLYVQSNLPDLFKKLISQGGWKKRYGKLVQASMPELVIRTWQRTCLLASTRWTCCHHPSPQRQVRKQDLVWLPPR